MAQSSSAITRPDVVSAGAVVWRRGQEVLLVHRARYDDWSFPKGKVDPGEHVTATAVREVAEETGVHVRLGAALSPQRYPLSADRMKTVHYWIGRAVGDDDVSGYEPNDEVDDVRWFPYDDAMEQLSYAYDQQSLREARKLRKKTHALVVLRHGHARARKTWRKDDRERPLLVAGQTQAQLLVPVLAAYDVTTIATSPSLRCVETVNPYAATTGYDLERYDQLSEEDADRQGVHDVIGGLLEIKGGVVACTHRQVLPLVCDALGLDEHALEPAGLLVVHHRKGRVLAIETHDV